MNLDNLPSLLLQILGEFPQIRLVYLFGSQASGSATPQSDVDLAIFCGEEEEHEIQARFQHIVSQLLQTDRVDVVLLSSAPIELAYNIIASGRLLYFVDLSERVEFESRVLARYGEYLPVLRMFRENILEGGQHGKHTQRYRTALERTQRALAETRTTPDETTE
jgi:predicted nucleotidyltransferase